ncbi:MAG: ABC transporter substrate-binding protein [Nannocystaceae bacterium]
MVAVSPLVDDQRYSDLAGAWPPSSPRIAGTSESLLALEPDLVIIASFTAPETRAFLAAHAVRTLELDTFTGWGDLDRHTRAIAAAVDAAAEGEALIDARRRRLAALAEEHRRGRPLAAIAWGDGLLAGADTTFDAIADAAGLKNMAQEQGLKGHVSIPVESIVAWDPEVIVIGCDPPVCADAEAELAARPGIAATRAARAGGIFAIPTRFLASTGDGMLTAAEALQARRIALTEAP